MQGVAEMAAADLEEVDLEVEEMAAADLEEVGLEVAEAVTAVEMAAGSEGAMVKDSEAGKVEDSEEAVAAATEAVEE